MCELLIDIIESPSHTLRCAIQLYFTNLIGIIIASLSQTWPELDNLHQAFVTFSTDVRMYQRPVTSVSQKESAAIIQHIDSMDDVHTCLDMHLQQYNEEFGNVPLNLMLSDSIIKHVIKIHRVLSYHHGLVLLCYEVCHICCYHIIYYPMEKIPTAILRS